MSKFIRMTDLDLKGKRVLIRADLNVPVKEGKVTSDARITASMATINHCLSAGARVMVTSHLGRPTEGEWSEENSLKPVADNIAARLGKPVRLIKDWVDGGFDVAAGELVVLENCRINKGEKKNVDETAKKYAALCDVFVMDAFGTAHRAEASTHGVAKYAPVACAGILLTEELDALDKALAKPARPMVAIVGGSKVSTKLTVLESLSEKVDQMVVGGGIANTFLKATGKNVGKSLCEADLVPIAQALIEKMTARGATIPIAVDVVVGKKFDAERAGRAQGCRRGGGRRDDLRHRPEERAGARRHHHEGGHRGLERSGRRVRVRPVRCRHQEDRRGDRRPPRPSPWPAAATPSPRSRSTTSTTRCPTSRRRAARSSSTSKARRCRRWRSWKSAPANDRRLAGRAAGVVPRPVAALDPMHRHMSDEEPRSWPPWGPPPTTPRCSTR